MARGEYAFHRFPNVLKQMLAVSDLECRWCTNSRTTRVFGRAITRNHFHAWVVAQPSGEGFRCAIDKPVNWSPLFKVNQECAIGMALAKSKIVDAENTRCWPGRNCCPPNDP